MRQPVPRPSARGALRGVVLMAMLAALVTGVAGVTAAREQPGVEQDLASVREAAARIPLDLAMADGERLSQDLATLSRAGGSADRGTSGATWFVAAHLGLGTGHSGALREAAVRVGTLAVAADALRAADEVLASGSDSGSGSAGGAGTAGGAVTAGGAGTLDALDDLARAVNGYASAATATGDPSATALDRIAIAAGLLADLAGAQAPRTWTVCRATAGPCTRVVISGAALTSWQPVPPSPAGHRADIRVTGVNAQDLFGPAGSAGSGARWNTAAVFRLLNGLFSSSAVTVHSHVPVEEWALRQLSR